MSTICAIATAPGGAIGIIRLSGPESTKHVSAIFSGNLQPRKVVFGNIIDNNTHAIVDEVLVTYFPCPHSYTGEDCVEISCHGSKYILQKVMQLLLQEGCVLAEPGEFTQRAFVNGKLDLSQAEAVADLIASNSTISHRLAMQQMRGGYSDSLKQLREQLLHLSSLLELELDFSDHEDLEFADRSQLSEITRVTMEHINQLIDSFNHGNVLKEGVPVAILGAPNVGKSTLLNQFLGEERAIVSDQAGTTRDTIEDVVSISGIRFRFVDTAGLRESTDDAIEKIGIQRSLSAAEKASILLLMKEPGVPYPKVEVRQGQHVIKIENKTSVFQAINGTGIDSLKEALVNAVKPSETDILVTNVRHYEALIATYKDLECVKNALNLGISGDLIAEDLRSAINHLAEITGEITSTDTLNNIFSHFCIGK